MVQSLSSLSFVEREERTLEFWHRQHIFQKSVEQRRGATLFSFYDGPPFATGLPHYGHILAGTIKDVVLRYKTMKGFFAPRRFGWDCHGLPVENEIEKAKQISGASSIESFGIAAFNEECRSIVLRYTKEWERTVHRMGRWVSFDNTYRTMDRDFMESVWWVFGQLYGRGLVYEGFKVMPFSTSLGTPLSNFEANLNYKEVEDPSLTLLFSLEDQPDTHFLVWTTTPWTLPSNLALMVHPGIEYVKIKEGATDRKYILAKARLPHYFKDPQTYQIEACFLGEKLIGRRYRPLFAYFAHKAQANAFRVLAEQSLSEEEGTGIVHAAPAFGEVDFLVCTRENIEPVCPVDHNGRFTAQVPEFAGLHVKDADRQIIRRLKEERRVFHLGQIRHRYPFCWRSDTPLIYKAVRTWFVAVEKLKEKLLVANAQVTWVPGHIKEGRFGKWLENARDWAISRNRYWGTPIPIWRGDRGDLIVISSVEELERRVGKRVEDLHRHFLDDLTFTEDGQSFRRIAEVFDCWFESGSMPYAQTHFPFERREETLSGFPAEFIAEGLDQTRGWFYTLMVLSVALFDKPAFTHVIVNGIILAEDGTKMSKRLKNYPEPDLVIDRYGADAVRLYLLHSQAVYADDLRFSEKGLELELRQVLIPLWNAFLFLSTYAEIYNWRTDGETLAAPEADIDRWILSVLQGLVEEVTLGMDRYELKSAVSPFVQFVDQLTNWYIRRCRPRFWADCDSADRRQAFATLHHVLLVVAQLAAPMIPFLAEQIYAGLKRADQPESVHLCDFPEVSVQRRNRALEEEMRLAQEVVSLGHALRKEHKLKVRQPLMRAYVISADAQRLSVLARQQSLIAEELNVKEVVLHSDEAKFVTLAVKPNFRTLGKKVGGLMNAVHEEIRNMSQAQLAQLLAGQDVVLRVQGSAISLSAEDVDIERRSQPGVSALSAGGISVALDTTLTEALLEEGLAREIVNKINTMRRDMKFAVSDRICITIDSTPRVQRCFHAHQEYIRHEVLARDVQFAPCDGSTWDLNGENATIALVRA